MKVREDEFFSPQELLLQDKSGKERRAAVTWSNWGPKIKPLDGGPSINSLDEYSLSMTHKIIWGKKVKLPSPIKVHASPVRYMDLHSNPEEVEEDIYPPSTEGWHGRERQSTMEALYLLHKEVDSQTIWLTILEPDSTVMFSHPIRDYEVFYITYEHLRWAAYNTPSYWEKQTKREEYWESLLKASPPTWEQLYQITEGYDTSSIEIGENMFETVSQLVPSEYPETVRRNYCVAIAAILAPQTHEMDPLEIYDMFRDMGPGGSMIPFWFTNIHREEGAKELVRVINRPRIREGITTPTPLSKWAHSGYEMSLSEISDEDYSLLVRLAAKCGRLPHAPTRLPITKAEAKKSKKKWLERNLLATNMFAGAGRFSPERIGLRSLIYMGSAYRWPHEHTSWQGFMRAGERKITVQEMLYPPDAAEKVSRVLKRVLQTRHYLMRRNYHIYDHMTHEWTYDIDNLSASVQNKMSEKKIVKDFNPFSGSGVYQLNRPEALVMDVAGQGMHLAELEQPYTYEIIGFGPKKFEVISRRLIGENVLRISYSFMPRIFTTRCLFLQGEMDHIRSLSHALLKDSPNCSAFLFDDSALIMLQLHVERMSDFLNLLQTRTLENDVLMESWSVMGYIPYRWRLLTRLLRDDGSWDNDISGLLRQGRGLMTELEDLE